MISQLINGIIGMKYLYRQHSVISHSLLLKCWTLIFILPDTHCRFTRKQYWIRVVTALLCGSGNFIQEFQFQVNFGTCDYFSNTFPAVALDNNFSSV